MLVDAAAVSACIYPLTACFNIIGVGSNKYKSNIFNFSTSCSGWMSSLDLAVCVL